MHFNDLIFKELIKRGYSLEGNTRVWNIADSKLWYLTSEQAGKYFELADSEEYFKRMTGKEIELLNKYAPEIVEKILHGSDVNIIDVGCGNGKKSVIFIKELCKKIKVRYCPVDISSFMVKEAVKNVRGINQGEVVDFNWNISDFDNIENVAALLRNEQYRQNFFLFLGNTIGNFEFHEVMYEMSEAIDRGDYILIGAAISPKEVTTGKPAHYNKHVDDFLGLVPLQIGFKKEELEFGMRYKNHRRETYYVVKNDKKLSFEGKEIYFNKGDILLVGVSYRYDPSEFKKFIGMYFKDSDFYFNEDSSWVLALCKK